MLKILEQSASTPLPAYAVPWSVNRRDPRHPVIVNDSADRVCLVRALVHTGTSGTRVEMWGTMRPGEQHVLCLCDADLDTMVTTILWFREPWGQEYVWPFVV